MSVNLARGTLNSSWCYSIAPVHAKFNFLASLSLNSASKCYCTLQHTNTWNKIDLTASERNWERHLNTEHFLPLSVCATVCISLQNMHLTFALQSLTNYPSFLHLRQGWDLQALAMRPNCQRLKHFCIGFYSRRRHTTPQNAYFAFSVERITDTIFMLPYAFLSCNTLALLIETAWRYRSRILRKFRPIPGTR